MRILHTADWHLDRPLEGSRAYSEKFFDIGENLQELAKKRSNSRDEKFI